MDDLQPDPGVFAAMLTTLIEFDALVAQLSLGHTTTLVVGTAWQRMMPVLAFAVGAAWAVAKDRQPPVDNPSEGRTA